jgi:FlaA1/EpsC-like NDP-sugar epimerase
MYVFLYKTFFLFDALFSVVTACLYNKLWVNRKFYPSTQSMQGKTVLITGGNAGIGYETAKDLLQRGWFYFFRTFSANDEFYIKRSSSDYSLPRYG